jgi:hypothetical protein
VVLVIDAAAPAILAAICRPQLKNPPWRRVNITIIKKIGGVLIPLDANQSQPRESPLSIFEENGEGPGVGLKPRK